MHRKTGIALLAASAIFVTIAAIPANNIHQAKDTQTADAATVQGLVRDIACPIQSKQSTATNFSKDCITKCAKAGSPLGILTKDGDVYVPLTETMPDTGQAKLQPFVGQWVSATGKTFLRNGTHGIEITDIHAVESLQ
ncbi:MAG: hypothetical protein WCA00_03315 [Candidatus Acidiferrales bacterium]